MNNDCVLLGEKILEKKYEIAKKVHESRLAGISEEEKQQIAHVEEEIITIRANYIGIYGEALKERWDDDKAFEIILSWGKETGKFIYNLGIPLDEALLDTSIYRMFIRKAIQEDVKEQNMPIDTVFEVLSIIDPLMDKAVYSFSLSYIHSYRDNLEKASRAFLALSAPLVPVLEGVAVLPMVGSIDLERAKYLLEHLPLKIQEHGIHTLISDFSGVYTIDATAMDYLFKISAILRLLGIRSIVTGLRPEIARDVVKLGMDLSVIQIYGTVKQALSEYACTDKKDSFVSFR
jgi:rsbT co-antagonist protein RsbR